MNKSILIGSGIAVLMVFYLGLSVYVKRYANTIEDYWVMGRKAKWWMFTGTLCASYVSMWTFMAGMGLAWGWGPLPPLLFYTSSLTFGWIIATILIGLRLRKLGCVSVTEYYQKRFGAGKDAKFFFSGLSLALAGSLFFYLLLQIQGSGIAVSTIFSIPMNVSVFIVVVLLAVTLDLAGMWSVVMSDTFSMIIFVLVAILILPITISSVGGSEAAVSAISKQNMWSATGTSGLDMKYFLGFALSWLAIVGGSPHIINRSLVVDTPKSILKGSFVAYILTIILTVVLFLSGSALVAAIEPKSMALDKITPYAALHVWPVYLSILVMGGAIAAAYTTANTQAFTISQSIVDLYRFGINKNASEKRLRNLTRVVSVLVLVGVGLVSTRQFWMLAIASSLAGIIFSLGFFPTLVLSLYWGRITRKATSIMLWASVPLGFFMILTNYFYKWFAPFPTLYSFPIGFGGLILLSYLTKHSQEEQEEVFENMYSVAFGDGGKEEKIVANKTDYITICVGLAVVAIVYIAIVVSAMKFL